MDLPNLFSVDTTQSATRLCAVIVTDTTVQTALLSVHVNGADILSQSNIVPYTDAKTLVYGADVAFQDLGKASEDVNEVVFILEESWLDADGSVDAVHQPLIEQLRKELLLNPVGFVVQQEAIVDYLLTKRPQLSSIFLLWQHELVNASWIEHGSLLNTVQCKRTGDLQSDMHTIFESLQKADSKRPLPSNVICTSVSLPTPTVTNLQQKLLEIDWPQLGSSSPPSVEVLTTQQASRAAFESSGQAMLDALGANKSVVVHDEPVSSEQEVVDDEWDLQDNDPDANVVSGPTELAEDGSLPATSPPPQRAQSSFGVPIKQRYETAVDDSLLPQNRGKLPTVAPIIDFDDIDPDEPLPKQSGAKRALPKKVLLIGGVILALLLVFLAALITMIIARKAEIVIDPKTEIIAQDVTLTLSATEESNATTRTIHANEVTAEVSGQSDTATTGVKLVGEKAKGEVTITNKTTDDKTFPTGAILSTNSLKYLLDEEVTIPAAVENEDGDGITYGKKNVKVTAAEIGVDSNIGDKTKFQVESFPNAEFEAVSVREINGGSSREVKVAAEADRTLLLADLKKDLAKQAQEKLQAELAENEQVVMSGAVAVVSSQYSVDVGVEADSIRLNLTVKAAGLSYTKADVKPIADEILRSSVPVGFTIEHSTPEILSAATTGSNGDTVVEANISAKAVAVIDQAAVASAVSGKSVAAALDAAKSQTGVADARIEWLPTLLRYLPLPLPSEKNIIVTTQIPK